MERNEAAPLAGTYARDMFADEEADGSLTLEDVDFDADTETWNITVGFLRPRDRSREAGASTATGPLDLLGKHTFKAIRIDDRTGRVISMTHRELRTR